MANVARRPSWLDEKDNWFIDDEFLYYVDGDLWTVLNADGGSAAEDADGVGGIFTMATGTTDNDEVAIATSNELFLFVAGKPAWCYGRIQWSEANTDDANVAFGWADALGANLLSDNGGGDNITNTGALIFKIDGETTWRCASENNGTITESVSNTTAGGSSYQELEIEAQEFTTLACVITYKVDGVYLRDSTTNEVIKHTLLYASATQMDFGVYAKAGGGNAETVNIDRLSGGQVR